MSNKAKQHHTRGLELLNKGWLDEALKELQKAVSLDPLDVDLREDLVQALMAKNDFCAALNQLLELISLHPENANAYHLFGNFIIEYGKDLAAMAYTKSIELSHAFPESHLNLALLAAEEGNTALALSEFSLAEQEAPEDLNIRYEYGCYLLEIGKWTEAISQFKYINKRNPGHIDSHVNLGHAYIEQGFYEEAKQALNTACKFSPSDFAANYYLAHLYTLLQKPGLAFKHLSEAIPLDVELFQEWMERDNYFATLRDDPRFIELIEEGQLYNLDILDE